MPPTPILDPGHLQRVRDHRDVVPKEGSRRQGFGAGRWDRSCHSQADRPSHRFLDGRPAPSCAALTASPVAGQAPGGTPAGVQSAVAGVRAAGPPGTWWPRRFPGSGRRRTTLPGRIAARPVALLTRRPRPARRHPWLPPARRWIPGEPPCPSPCISLRDHLRPADEIGPAFLGTEEKYRVRMSSVISRRNRESDVYSGRVFRYLPCYSMLPFLGVPGAKRRGDVGAEPRRRAGERLQAGQRRSGTSGDPHPQWSRSHHRSPDVARRGERPEGRG